MVEPLGDGQYELDLPATVRFASDGLPCAHVVRRADGSRRQLKGHCRVEHLGECMQFGKAIHRLHDLARKQSGQRRDHFCELVVATRVVARSVKLLEEEGARGAIARLLEQVSIGAGKASLLERLERLHIGIESRRAGALPAFALDDAQLSEDVFRNV